MTISLKLSPETEARLIAHAEASGVSVEQYLQLFIENNLPTEVKQPLQVETVGEWAGLLEAFCNNPALVNVPPLSDEAISRESIYREREDNQI